MTKFIVNNNRPVDITKEITSNFRIKVYSNHDQGKSLNSLRGCSGLIALIGFELANKFMINAIMSDDQIIIHKLRRGLTITFYSR